MQNPANLQRALVTFITNAVANTVNAGLVALIAPPAPPNSRYRLWSLSLTVNHSTSAPAAAATSRVVVRDFGLTGLFVLSVNTNTPHDRYYFHGGYRLIDNSGIIIDNNSSAASQALALTIGYTIERV